MLKGLMLEFFHTEAGAPCMIGHYDNFYDGRQRFILLRARFKDLLYPWSGTFVWVHDRGYWGYEFLRSLIELGDKFIQWEKDYQSKTPRFFGHFLSNQIGHGLDGVLAICAQVDSAVLPPQNFVFALISPAV